MHERLCFWLARGMVGLANQLEGLISIGGKFPDAAAKELIEAARKILRLMGVN